MTRQVRLIADSRGYGGSVVTPVTTESSLPRGVATLRLLWSYQGSFHLAITCGVLMGSKVKETSKPEA